METFKKFLIYLLVIPMGMGIFHSGGSAGIFPPSMEKKLRMAIENDDLGGFKDILASERPKKEINWKASSFHSQDTVLTFAVKEKKLEFVKVILLHLENKNEMKKGVNHLAKNGFSALGRAVMGLERGKEADQATLVLMKYLLEKGADPLQKQGNFQSILALAIEKGDLEVFKLLVDHNPAKALAVMGDHTALDLAVSSNQVGMAQALLEKGADPNSSPSQYDFPLHSALYQKNLAMIQLLLQFKADPNIRSKFYPFLRPLGVAVGRDLSLDIIKALLNQGAYSNAKVSYGTRILEHAIRSHRLDLANLLLEKGAHQDFLLNYYNDNGSPLNFAVHANNPSLVKLLLKYKADPHRNYSNYGKILPIAIINRNLLIIEALLQAGVHPDEGKGHLLQMALQNHDLPQLALALRYKANPHYKSNNQYSPLGRSVSPMEYAQSKYPLYVDLFSANETKDKRLPKDLLKVFRDHAGDPVLAIGKNRQIYFNILLGLYLDSESKTLDGLKEMLLAARANDITIDPYHRKSIYQFQEPFYLTKLEEAVDSCSSTSTATPGENFGQGQELQKLLKDLQCQICFDSFRIKPAMLLSQCQCATEKQYACQECAHKHFQDGLKEGKFPMNCPLFCKGKITAGDLERANMAPEEIYNYRKWVLRNKLMPLPWKSCQTQNCINGTFVNSDEHQLKIFDCPLCLEARCLDCGMIHKEITPCEEAKSGEAGFQDLVKQGVVQICPKCKTPTVRINNCSHIHCSQCNFDWSYKGDFREQNAGWE